MNVDKIKNWFCSFDENWLLLNDVTQPPPPPPPTERDVIYECPQTGLHQMRKIEVKIAEYF